MTITVKITDKDVAASNAEPDKSTGAGPSNPLEAFLARHIGSAVKHVASGGKSLSFVKANGDVMTVEDALSDELAYALSCYVSDADEELTKKTWAIELKDDAASQLGLLGGKAKANAKASPPSKKPASKSKAAAKAKPKAASGKKPSSKVPSLF